MVELTKDDLALSEFDIAQYLDTDELREAFLKDAFESDDPELIACAIGTVARAKSITKLAQDTGMSRAGVYKSFSKNGNPSLKSLLGLLNNLGYHLTVTPKT
jgi:probable addiction module antidote protein